MSDWSYLVVVAAGVIMIWQQAFSQFETPLKVDQNHRYPILNEVEIKDLTSDSVYRYGRWIYIVIFLILYIVGLQVWDIVESINSDGLTSQESGPQGAVPGETAAFFLDREGYGRPIYIASALISLISVGALSKYERSLRAFAHRQAGIPDNIYRVTGRLSRAPYAEIAKGQPTLRVRKFNAKLNDLDKLAPAGLAISDENVIGNIRQHLIAIDLLEPAVVGDQFSATFQLNKVHLLGKLIEREREEMIALSNEISALTGEEDAFHRLSASTERAKNNLQAMFAVLYLKDSDSKFESANAPTKDIIKRIKSDGPDHAVSSAYLAIFTTLFLGAFGAFFIGYASLKVAADQSCDNLMGCDPRHLSFVANRSLPTYLEGVAILSAAALTATIRRRNMVEARNWEEWNFNQAPIPRLVQAAIAPAILGTLAFAGVIFLERVYGNMALLLPPFDFNFARLIAFNIPFLIVAVIVSFLTSLCVIVVSDMHLRLTWLKSLTISLAFVLLIFLSALAVLSVAYGFTKEDVMAPVLDYFLLSSIFLGAFTLAIERSEIADSDDAELGIPS